LSAESSKMNSRNRGELAGGLGAGKLPPDLLVSHVLKYTGYHRPEVVSSAALGEDSAVIDLGGDMCVVSTDPITAASEEAGSLAVHVSCNDVAANGAEPVALLLTIMVPVGTTASWIRNLMEKVHQTASDLGVQIVGGHTEITPGLRSPILCGTVIGRASRQGVLKSGGAHVGDRLVMTRAAGIEGTSILASDYPEYSRAVLGSDGWQRACAMSAEISVVRHARSASRAGVTAMHDVTEGGILGAAFEMAAAAGCGVEVDAGSIPVRQETALLCASLGIDSLRLISSGCLLIAAPDAGRVTAAVRADDPQAECTEIGQFTSREKTVTRDGRSAILSPPSGDELWVAKKKLDAKRLLDGKEQDR